MTLLKIARRLSLCAFLCLGCLGAPAVYGQIYEGDTPENFGSEYPWNNASNWQGGLAPTTSGAVIFQQLGGGTPAGAYNLTIGDNVQAGSITFANALYPNYQIGVSGTPNSILFGANGSITNNASSNGATQGNQVFNAGVNLTAGAGVATISNTNTGSLRFAGSVNRTGGTLSVVGSNGSIAFSGPVSATTLNLSGQAAGSTSFSQSLSVTSLSVSGGNANFTGAVTAPTLTVSGGTANFSSAVNAATAINVTGGQATFLGNVTAGNLLIGGSAVPATAHFGPSSLVTVNGGVTVGNGGVVTGNANFNGATIVGNGGTLQGGKDLNFNNGLSFQTGSTFSWDLSSTTPIDLNNLVIGSGVQSILDFSSPLPANFWDANWTRTVLTGDSTPTGLFSSIAVASGMPAKEHFAWIVDCASGAVQLSYSVTAVPEPSSMILLGVAGAIGGVVARRRAKKASQPVESPAVVA